jgi:hypothetical protein
MDVQLAGYRGGISVFDPAPGYLRPICRRQLCANGAITASRSARIPRRPASRLSHERRLWHRDKSARNERRHETLGGGTKLTLNKRGHERHAIPTAAGLEGRKWAVKETVAACVRRQDAV